MDFVWYRTIRALDRLQMEDISLDKKNGRIRFTLPTQAQLSSADDEEVDEIAESSGFMNWLKGKTGSKGDGSQKIRAAADRNAGLCRFHPARFTRYGRYQCDRLATSRRFSTSAGLIQMSSRPRSTQTAKDAERQYTILASFVFFAAI